MSNLRLYAAAYKGGGGVAECIFLLMKNILFWEMMTKYTSFKNQKRPSYHYLETILLSISVSMFLFKFN